MAEGRERLDRWGRPLLLRYPELWVMRVHVVAPLCALLLVLATLSAAISPLSPSSVPNVAKRLAWGFVALLPLALGWMSLLARDTPALNPVGGFKRFAVFVSYVVCMTALVLPALAYSVILAHRIAGLKTTKQLDNAVVLLQESFGNVSLLERLRTIDASDLSNLDIDRFRTLTRYLQSHDAGGWSTRIDDLQKRTDSDLMQEGIADLRELCRNESQRLHINLQKLANELSDYGADYKSMMVGFEGSVQTEGGAPARELLIRVGTNIDALHVAHEFRNDWKDRLYAWFGLAGVSVTLLLVIRDIGFKIGVAATVALIAYVSLTVFVLHTVGARERILGVLILGHFLVLAQLILAFWIGKKNSLLVQLGSVWLALIIPFIVLGVWLAFAKEPDKTQPFIVLSYSVFLLLMPFVYGNLARLRFLPKS
jgi:hypothetical protein